MSKLSVGLVAAMLLWPAIGQALELKGNTITLSPEEMTKCIEGGGCLLVPQAVLQHLIETSVEQGKKMSNNTSCLKNST
jgi:hypothetical protein